MPRQHSSKEATVLRRYTMCRKTTQGADRFRLPLASYLIAAKGALRHGLFSWNYYLRLRP